MKKLLIGILFVVLCCNSVSAQVRSVDGRPSAKELARLNAVSKRDSLKGTFEHLELVEGNTFRGRIDRFIIPQGDSARIKYVFDNNIVSHIAVEGGGMTTPIDVRKGVFETKISPKKTTWVDVGITRKLHNGTIHTLNVGFRVIVVAPEKYDSIMAVYNILPAGKRRSDFTDALAGGSYRDFRLGKIK